MDNGKNILYEELNLNIKTCPDLDGRKITQPSGSPNHEFGKYVTERKNNNHHVVPLGIIIVLVTIYLGMNSIQNCFVNCSENEIQILEKSTDKESTAIVHADNRLKDSQILERFLEYKGICKDLEVFTKDINTTEENDSKREGEEKMVPLGTELDSGSGGSGGGDWAKPSSKKKKKSKYSIKLSTNGKNGFHKNNKSYTNKAKYINDKKDLHLNKKNSTAEPIIYLFALVFVYLLLKAASDINQHYKSQTKNDKRLRRCSLQSYAQTHRTADRRSSKELALKQKQQRLMASSRSTSIEQQQLQQQPLRGFYFSSENNTSPTQPSQLIRTTTSSNWQLLRQHMTHSSVDTLSPPSTTKAEFFSTTNRRCSVPVLNYQKQTHKNSVITFGGGTDPLINRRRTSITMPLLDAIDPLAIETKRRVRMINRH